MKDVELIRVGSKIYHPTGELHTDHKTINKAKKASLAFQSSGGTPGDGRLRVALKAPQVSQPAAAA